MTSLVPRIVRMTIEYDGTSYAGWQRQINARSVQQVVEESLERHLGEQIRITASGRTDSGVHAMGQVISFPTQSTIEAGAIGRGLLPYLPPDIAVVETSEAAPDFDARRCARLRWYRFFLCNRRPRPAVGARYLTHVIRPLHLDRMREAAELLSGDNDYQAFRAITCSSTRTRLSLQPITITEMGDGIICLDFRCRSFLHNMVRILTGTMVSAATGKLELSQIQTMLDTGVRHIHAVTVQPQGLFLWRVFYDGDEFEADPPPGPIPFPV